MPSPQAFDPAAGPATPVLVGFGEVGADGAGGLPPLERLTDLLAVQLGRRPLLLNPALAPDGALAALAAATRSPAQHGDPVGNALASRDGGAQADRGNDSDGSNGRGGSDCGSENDNNITNANTGSGGTTGITGTGDSDGLACLPFDVGLPLADGRCWAEALGAWRQPCLLVFSAAQLRTGLPAAGCALLRQGRVPLLGLLQWGDPWDEGARRRDGLPWLGLLRDPEAAGEPPIAPSRLEEQLQAQLGLAGALARRWRQLRLP